MIKVNFTKVESCYVNLNLESKEEAIEIVKSFIENSAYDTLFLSEGDLDGDEDNESFKKLKEVYISSGNYTVEDGASPDFEIESAYEE
ncbi:hypothetical protein [Winogradskyella poriferorum]|uniref:hypothetical protein n=1 Tax=Winogradskyella poriferorum TaxID=307627 RepID=UPI003D657B0A